MAIVSWLALAALVVPFAPRELDHRGLVAKTIWAVFALGGGFGIMGIVFAMLPGGIPWSWLAVALVLASVVVNMLLCSQIFVRSTSAGGGARSDQTDASAATR